MFTHKQIEKMSENMQNLSDWEIREVIRRIQELATMQNQIAEKYEVNPMVFSYCGIVQ